MQIHEIHGLLLLDPGQAPEPGWIRVEKGRIAEIQQGKREGSPERGVLRLGPHSLICPAFIDAHLHLPQIGSIGADGLELLDWLQRVIYPAETWWGDGGASHLLDLAIAKMVENGTLGFAGYLTSHGEVNAEVLRRIASGAGLPGRLRWIAGRVAMDRDAPEALLAEDLARHQSRPPVPVTLPDPPAGSEGARGEVSVNPRFAISCTDELLAEAGWFVKERKDAGRPIYVQTHLSESRAEVQRIKELFPDDPNYASVYDRHGLLNERTLLGHCNLLEREEWELIAERRSVTVHCPVANIFLIAGLFDFDAAREHGVRVGLGSDVAAGADAAMPRVARAMIETAKLRSMTIAPKAWIPTPADAWRQMTVGNAEALGWSDAGRLEVGAAADLLAITTPASWMDDHLIGRVLYNWEPSLISARVAGGQMVEAAVDAC